MWPRHFELFLAIWISISWLIFRYPQDSLLMYHDFVIAAMISTISLLNYKYRYINLLNLVVAVWLIGLVYYSKTPITNGPFQNYMSVGLLLLLFAILPPFSLDPPQEWIDFFKDKE